MAFRIWAFTIMMAVTIKLPAQNLAGAPELPAGLFPLGQITLLDGPFLHAEQVNRKVVLAYDPDRLLAPFRAQAGLKPRAASYGNWENTGLDGHTAGHYLTALAQYAARGDAEMQQRLNYMIDELAECQAASGDGYIGGVPRSGELWREIAAGNVDEIRRRWVPWYNLHKTFAGLRDAWLLTGNEKARAVLVRYAEWCDKLCANLDDDQMAQMLDTEYGGMNEVMADVASITGNPKFLRLAERFSHRRILDPLARGEDMLDGLHANTQVPKVIGFQRIANLGGEDMYADAARFFWATVVKTRSLAFGGNSMREHFPRVDQAETWLEEREGPESCNTYNMMRLTEQMFLARPSAELADFYERAMFNHILSTQHPEHGGYVYFTPARPRHYRVYSAPEQAFWCCVGTGLENHGKYEEFIYAFEPGTVYVNLFVASKLNVPGAGTMEQQTRFPYEPRTKIINHLDAPLEGVIKIRKPYWVAGDGLKIAVNGGLMQLAAGEDGYVAIQRTWQPGDTVEVELPMHLHSEPFPNLPEYQALLYGPIVLAAETGTEDLAGLVADDSRWGHIANGPLEPLNGAPMLVGESGKLLDAVKPTEDALRFTAAAAIRPDTFDNLLLKPFFEVHDARTMMYWRTATPDEYERVVERTKSEEHRLLALDRRTVDKVQPGEQQPEADHNLQQENSNAGSYHGTPLRHSNGGWFSYDVRVAQGEPNELMLTWWGDERGRRTCDILIDGQLLATENLVGQWNKPELVDKTYPIAPEMIEGKGRVTVRFQAHEGNYAGGLFGLRVVKAEE